MTKPTRSQWRGYAILIGLLLVFVIVLVFWPMREEGPTSADCSQLAEAVDKYGDEIIQQEQVRYDSYHQQYKQRRDTFRYDSSKRNERVTYTNPYDTLIVDINTADTTRLQMLRGIGSVFANRIVKYRALLGGFVNTEQLLEVYGMTEDRYLSIEPHITLSKSNVKMLLINLASLDDLRHHPYIDYYQARAIINYRNTVGPIRNSEDLMKISLLDENTIRKIAPYIQYN